jgi:hypothetical protein
LLRRFAPRNDTKTKNRGNLSRLNLTLVNLFVQSDLDQSISFNSATVIPMSRRMPRKVPGASSLWSGIGTVIADSVIRRIILWLPLSHEDKSTPLQNLS